MKMNKSHPFTAEIEIASDGSEPLQLQVSAKDEKVLETFIENLSDEQKEQMVAFFNRRR
jgi:hypothetical protein